MGTIDLSKESFVLKTDQKCYKVFKDGSGNTVEQELKVQVPIRLYLTSNGQTTLLNYDNDVIPEAEVPPTVFRYQLNLLNTNAVQSHYQKPVPPACADCMSPTVSGINIIGSADIVDVGGGGGTALHQHIIHMTESPDQGYVELHIETDHNQTMLCVRSSHNKHYRRVTT